MTSPRLKSTIAGRRNEPSDCWCGGRGEEKRLIEFTSAGEFRLARTQPGILRNFTQGHVVESGDADAAFLGDLIQRQASFLVKAALEDGQISSNTHCPGNFDIEITVRNEDPASVLRDEGMIMFQLAAKGLDLRSSPRGHENQRYAPMRNFCETIIRPSKGIGARVKQRAFKGGEDQLTQGKQSVGESNVRIGILEGR